MALKGLYQYVPNLFEILLVIFTLRHINVHATHITNWLCFLGRDATERYVDLIIQ
jgi:hypothetical protein